MPINKLIKALSSDSVLPKMSLQDVDFTPVNIKPYVYQAEPQDHRVLERSLEKAKQWESGATNASTGIDASLMEFRSKLEKEDQDWLSEKTKEMQSSIDFHVNNGNYGTAIRLSQQAAKDLLRDTELQDRVASSTAYRNYITKVNNSKVSEITKARFREETQYNYKGADYYNNLSLPVDPLTSNQFLDLIVHNTSPTTTNRTVEGKQYRNPHIYDYTDADRDSKVPNYTIVSNTDNVTELSYDKLKETYELLLTDPQYSDGFRQEFQDSLWAYNKAQQMLNDPTITDAERRKYQSQQDEYAAFAQLATDENGIAYTEAEFKQWMDEKYLPLLKQRAYKNTGESVTYGQPALKAINKIPSDKKSDKIDGTVTVMGDNAEVEATTTEKIPTSDEVSRFY